MTKSPEIPKQVLASLVRFLQTLPPDHPFRTISATEWRVEPLNSLTNNTFLVSSIDAALVVRLLHKEGALALDREAELHNLAIVAELGLAPAILHAELDRGVLISEYLAGSRPLEDRDFARAEIQGAVGGLLNILQRSRRQFHGHQDPKSAIDTYLQIHADQVAAGLRSALGPALDLLRQTAPAAVPAHVDPHPSNFLMLADGKLALVDWEFSAMADPCWDVAACLNSMPEDDSVLYRIASATFGTISGFGAARLRVFQVALFLVAGSWAAMEAASRKDPVLSRLAANYLDKCRSWIEQGKLSRAIDEMSARPT